MLGFAVCVVVICIVDVCGAAVVVHVCSLVTVDDNVRVVCSVETNDVVTVDSSVKVEETVSVEEIVLVTIEVVGD